MATTKKTKAAARKNIRKAQSKWQSMSKRARARAQPEGRSRQKPGTTGEGDYYRIQVRPKSQFVTFRTQDVGRQGHVQRVAGKRSSGSWDTQTWLISKEGAHVEGTTLKADTKEVAKVLDKLGSTPKKVKGDVFKAKPRENVPEKAKPTPRQRRARAQNIKKAQAARHQRSA